MNVTNPQQGDLNVIYCKHDKLQRIITANIRKYSGPYAPTWIKVDLGSSKLRI